jgi:hypothetical protein
MTEREPVETRASIRQQFREDFEFAIRPLRDDARINYEGAIKFADSGIKALFGLSGGGLIALPAFAALFKTDMKAATGWIVAAAVMFVIGLIFAALTCLFGYLSGMKGGAAFNQSSTAAGIKYVRHYQQAPETPQTSAEIKAAEDAAARHTTWSNRLRAIAVGLSIASLAAFIIGAYLAGRALVPLPP